MYGVVRTAVLFILIVSLLFQAEASGLCSSNSDCTAVNKECISGICQCKQGFTIQNGECTQVFERACLDNLDCNDGRTLCDNNQCRCESSIWREEGGVCVSYFGTTCTTWADCGHSGRYQCKDSECVCAKGYRYVNESNCEKVLYRNCETSNKDEDCPLEGAYCGPFWWNSYSGTCKCRSGFTEVNDMCVKVLGSNCDEVACGNPMHRSYKYLSGENIDYWNDWNYYRQYHIHLSCNTDNVCSCDHGFVLNGTSCVRVLGRPCATNLDCGGYPGYRCDQNSSTCICDNSFYEVEEGWYYDEDQNNQNMYYYWWDWYEYRLATLCLPIIGSSCLHEYDMCSVENSFCADNLTCECIEGYTLTNTGDCEQVLGMTCFRDTLCQLVDGGTCGKENTCVCKEGYQQQDAVCIRALGSNCMENKDCPLDNSVCVDGKCKCSVDFTELGNLCLKQICAENVAVLPDLHRRSRQQVAVRDEPVIDDALLDEGWYSIGEHSLYVNKTAPAPGHCSTYHPIHLTENLSASQMAAITSGEITVSAVVGGLDVYGTEEYVNLKMRKCGKDTQIYLQAPKTHFSGICIENGRMTTARRSGGMHVAVVPDLLFEASQDSNRTKYTPYVVFTCLPSETVVKLPFSRYPYTEFIVVDDINFYYVHWYIDDKHYRSFGPVSRKQFVNQTSLSEGTLLAEGYRLGFKIRCSFEITNTPNANKVLVATSADFLTGIQNTFVTVLEKDGGYYDLLNSDTPLGCESYEGDDTKSCDVRFQLVTPEGDPLCVTGQTEDIKSEACTFTFPGFTYDGYMRKSRSWHYPWDRHYSYYWGNNGTHYIYSYQYFVLKINVTGISTVRDFKVKFKAAGDSKGHKLWENYDMPDMNGYVIDGGATEEVCNVTLLNVPMVSVDEWAAVSESVAIESAGEYIMYRSRTKPVEVQVQTENCSSSSSDGICLCSVTYRDGNSIFTVNYCNGLARIGQVHGESINRNISNVRLLNGMVIDIATDKGRIVGFRLSSNYSMAKLSDGEGICTFTTGSFRFRNGAEMSTNEGFSSSWKVQQDESLMNPKSHTSFTWSDEYISCVCPSSAKDRVIVYSSSGYSYYDETVQIFTGDFQCSSDNICSTSHEGEEWPESLLPSYALEHVSAGMKIRYVGKSPLLHLYCDFDRETGYRYKIFWRIDGNVEYQSDLLTTDQAQEFFITNKNLGTTEFVLESGISCGVSIHDKTGKKLLDPKYSEEMRAIEFIETEILMRRGGDVTVQLRLNIPLVCNKGSSCSFDFKLFDPTESHKCADSTIAFKNKYTCGQRVLGFISETDIVNQPSIVNITITTKNNDKYLLRDTFTLKMRLNVNGATSNFWAHTFKKTLTVFVRDDEVYWQGNYCYVNNDPRVRTFDGQYYSLFQLGEFVMMRHKTLPIEVQIETHYYGWYSCAVTVRAGRDVYTINHCHGDHITGYLLADDMILRVKQRSEHRYELYLPQGTRIDVRVSSWWMYMVNVFIYPSPSDMNQVEGLCGNFDGNIYGDLIHSDGSVTWSTYYYWWWWWVETTDAFVRSWMVGENSGSQSLTDIELIEGNLESWYKKDVFCVCTGKDGNGEVKCSANERDTCLTPVDSPGEDVVINVRPKRSGQVLDKEYKRRLRKMREKRAAYKYVERRSASIQSEGDVNAAINANVESCRTALSSACGIMSVQDNGLNVTFEELVNNCGQDKQVDPDTDWTALTCEAIEANVEQEIQRDVQFQEENPEIAKEILKNLCVGNCTGNGDCINGTCVCFLGFTASDCSLDLSREVVIEGITGDGICDTQTYDCTCIRMTTSGSLQTSTYQLTHRKYDKETGWVEAGNVTGTVVYDNFNEVFVCPETSSRKKRSTFTETTMAEMFDISLSNDGTTFSRGSKVFIVDSRCLDVVQSNDSDSVELKPGFCLIGGVCYADNVASSSDSCLMCNETADMFAWSRNNTDSCKDDDTEEDETKDKGNSIYIIAGAVGSAAVLAIIAAIVAVYSVKTKLKNRVNTVVNTDTLYEMPKNSRFEVIQLRKDAWLDRNLD